MRSKKINGHQKPQSRSISPGEPITNKQRAKNSTAFFLLENCLQFGRIKLFQQRKTQFESKLKNKNKSVENLTKHLKN